MSPTATATHQVPTLDPEGGLRRYLREIQSFPMISQDREITLGRQLRDTNDANAAHVLVTSHLRLVPAVARKFRGYGLPLGDIIAEGNVGLMKAVRRFDPEKGFRLATYAMWWIRASIQDYILKSVSIVRIGSTAAQKRLFFGLRRAKQKIQAYGSYLTKSQTTQLASKFMVDEDALLAMNDRISAPDQSLNLLVGDGDSTTELIEMLPDENETTEVALIQKSETMNRSRILAQAIDKLNEREREILTARRLQEPCQTLEQLSQKFGISRERVRQIENRSLKKLQADIVGTAEFA